MIPALILAALLLLWSIAAQLHADRPVLSGRERFRWAAPNWRHVALLQAHYAAPVVVFGRPPANVLRRAA